MEYVHSSTEGAGKAGLADCIRACFECAQACKTCADACLRKDMATQLGRCICISLYCAQICAATGHALSVDTGSYTHIVRAVLEACEAACKACADVCGRNASIHEHCRVCAEVCRRCEHACATLRMSPTN